MGELLLCGRDIHSLPYPQPVASIDGVPHRRYASVPSKQSVDYRRNPAASNKATRYTFSFPAPRSKHPFVSVTQGPLFP